MNDRDRLKGSAHISKLTEAAWIQDVRSARARRQRLLELFRDYRAAVDAIVMLRAFCEPDTIPSMDGSRFFDHERPNALATARPPGGPRGSMTRCAR